MSIDIYIYMQSPNKPYMSITCDEIVTRTFFRLDEEKEKKNQIWISMKETTMTKKYINIEYFTLTHSWKHQPPARIFSWIEQYLEKREKKTESIEWTVYTRIFRFWRRNLVHLMQQSSKYAMRRRKKSIRDSTLSCIMCVEIAQSCAFSKSLVQRITL